LLQLLQDGPKYKPHQLINRSQIIREFRVLKKHYKYYVLNILCVMQCVTSISVCGPRICDVVIWCSQHSVFLPWHVEVILSWVNIMWSLSFLF